MKDRSPRYEVVLSTKEKVVIHDIGPWDRHLSVTNGAEQVVSQLYESGQVRTQRLFYVDTEGEPGELNHDGKGTFLGFSEASQADLV